MKARKVDLSQYELGHLPLQKDGKPFIYNVRGSLAELCFMPELELNGVALLEANKLAQSILEAAEEFILLSEIDWGKLLEATNRHKGFARNDVELVRRIKEAPEVEVAPK